MKQIKIIIGAGFGDEGKGLVTSHFLRTLPGKSLNVLYNGGPQRGHTNSGFVFHALGVGANEGMRSMYYDTFMTNPIALAQEFVNFNEFDKNFRFSGVEIQGNSPVTLPYDVMINRAIERKRNNNRHGSCGMGIYETYLRHRNHPIFAADLKNEFTLYDKIKEIEKNYVPKRLKELGLTYEDVFWNSRNDNKEIVTSTGIMKSDRPFSIDGFFDACNICRKEKLWKIGNREMYGEIPDTFKEYDNIVFEGGQGLLLDENNMEFFPNVTGSSTGSKYISKLINSVPKDVTVEVVYVTRSFMTRHGVGKFDTECEKDKINKNIVDNTNKENEFQGKLRFGYFDTELIVRNIKKDLMYYSRPVKKSLAVTHLNYTNGMICTKNGMISLDELKNEFNKNGVMIDGIYESWNKIEFY